MEQFKPSCFIIGASGYSPEDLCKQCCTGSSCGPWDAVDECDPGATALIPCLMLPVTAHPEFGLRYLCGVWSYQLKVQSMKRLLVVYQLQDMDCLCDRAYGHDPLIDGL